MAETGIQPVYYELSWSILSTICIANVLFGGLVIGITSFSPIATVPIITSIAGAIANGLCYYAFYNDSYPTKNQAIASIFADMGWLVRRSPVFLEFGKLLITWGRFKKLASRSTVTSSSTASSATPSGKFSSQSSGFSSSASSSLVS